MAPGGAAPSAPRPPMSSIAFCSSPLAIKGEGSGCSLDSGGALGMGTSLSIRCIFLLFWPNNFAMRNS
eukprot:2378-Pyramimonas_sp.AAC.1